jgi:predicted transcriptional regulator
MLRPFDHAEIARFSNEHALKYDNSSEISYQDIKPFLYRLPPRETDLIELYYKEQKNQKDIAKMFGVTQGAVSSRLSRAKKRLKFLKSMPKISEDEIDKNLGIYFDWIELEIIKHMIKTTCQSKTAQMINEKYGLLDIKQRMTQVKVRHRYDKCILRVKEETKKRPELVKYQSLMESIKSNLYMLHEVKLPHFDRSDRVIFSMVI